MEEEIKKEIIGKAGFPLYVDYWEKYFLDMSGEQVKECLKIIFHFNTTFEVLRSDDMAVRMVINTIIDNLKRDAQKRIKQSKASRGNGLLGGRPKKDDKPKTPKKPLDNPTGDLECKSESESQFEEFWNLYNKKIGRAETEKKFVLALKKVSFEKLTEGLKNYTSKRGNDSKYWKHPATWLNAESWNDEYSTETKTLEVKSQKEIWAEKILKSNKPADYEEVMEAVKIEADYRYFENDNFYFLAESEEVKARCKQRVVTAELDLFKIKEKQCKILIISKNYFNGN